MGAKELDSHLMCLVYLLIRLLEQTFDMLSKTGIVLP